MNGMKERLDGAVIMARGAGRRMGAVKGLLACPDGDGEPFVARIAACYQAAGIEGVVVCVAAEAERYAAAVAQVKGVQVVTAPAGGETARTVYAGWRALSPEVTHVWAHPVDLPLVQPATLAQLQAVVEEQGERVVRPVHCQTPGHPVIVPVTVLRRLAARESWRQRPMLSVLNEGAAAGRIGGIVAVPTSDPGVVADFDEPGDFEDNSKFVRG